MYYQYGLKLYSKTVDNNCSGASAHMLNLLDIMRNQLTLTNPAIVVSMCTSNEQYIHRSSDCDLYVHVQRTYIHRSSDCDLNVMCNVQYIHRSSDCDLNVMSNVQYIHRSSDCDLNVMSNVQYIHRSSDCDLNVSVSCPATVVSESESSIQHVHKFSDCGLRVHVQRTACTQIQRLWSPSPRPTYSMYTNSATVVSESTPNVQHVHKFSDCGLRVHVQPIVWPQIQQLWSQYHVRHTVYSQI